jgi:2-isopropylmalate synthase
MEQVIDIGPMSGKSNVLFWLDRHGIAANDEIVDRIYKRAKASDRLLTEAEILECCQAGAESKPSV